MSVSASILIIEDDDVMRNILSGMVSDRGYDYHAVSSFEDAMKAVKFRNYTYIIADIFMGGMGGIEGIRQIKRFDPFIPVLAVSGGWDNVDAEKAVEAAKMVGADCGLAKPFDAESFDAALERLKASAIA